MEGALESVQQLCPEKLQKNNESARVITRRQCLRAQGPQRAALEIFTKVQASRYTIRLGTTLPTIQ